MGWKNEDIEIRAACKLDEAFIFATWLNCYRNYSKYTRRIRKNIFFKEHHRIIEKILARPEIGIWIAHPIDEPDVILGYLVTESTNTIHFMYIKPAFRRIGVARSLVEASEIENADQKLKDVHFSHWTEDSEWILEKYTDLIYNPYLQSVFITR